MFDISQTGLFVSALVSATLLPMGSEAVLAALLLKGGSPVTLVLIATVANVLGSLVNYVMGYWANQGWLARQKPDVMRRAEQQFRRYGCWSLLLAWVPIIGDPLTLIAGMLRVNLLWFVGLVTLGKALRYIVLTLLIL
ncbi:membrane protein YqaA, SNARE-associated domain [Kushneria avicenniae]|uniref:Membrane protein YqaA, SNARE-associated domain n=1 Tax=Kushneria avicenniae TaxID=402385 RepID=A0A1I1KNQ0_9GAMM|nr:YqaA family protein [Kushneria avicenniae]SFC61902.1 membrane protein YqaA, SNARE-associated domain [Kushneria avicenniae]